MNLPATFITSSVIGIDGQQNIPKNPGIFFKTSSFVAVRESHISTSNLVKPWKLISSKNPSGHILITYRLRSKVIATSGTPFIATKTFGLDMMKM